MMSFFKHVFLLSLLIFLLATGAHAAPTRTFFKKPEKDQILPTTEEGTALGRRQAESQEISELNQEDTATPKRAKMETSSKIVETSSQSVAEIPVEFPLNERETALTIDVATTPVATSFIEIQQMFLERSSQLTEEERSQIQSILNGYAHFLSLQNDPAGLQHSEITERLHQYYLQIFKAYLSVDPRVKKIKNKVIEGNIRLSGLDAMMIQNKLTRDQIISCRDVQLAALNDETTPIAQFYEHDAIVKLYDMPLSFLEKEMKLLGEARAHFLAGETALSMHQSELSQGWQVLAVETANSVSGHVGVGVIVTEKTLLTQHQKILKKELENEDEESSCDTSETGSIEPPASPLPWNFEKTFEENVEKLPPLVEERAITGLMESLNLQSVRDSSQRVEEPPQPSH